MAKAPASPGSLAPERAWLRNELVTALIEAKKENTMTERHSGLGAPGTPSPQGGDRHEVTFRMSMSWLAQSYREKRRLRESCLAEPVASGGPDLPDLDFYKPTPL